MISQGYQPENSRRHYNDEPRQFNRIMSEKPAKELIFKIPNLTIIRNSQESQTSLYSRLLTEK